VLSEIPAQWGKALRQWRELNRDKKQLVDDVLAPSRNDEYLLYQTLVGGWPFKPELATHSCFRDRIKAYMLKAVREAKEKSSWANPNTSYETAVTTFVDAILSPREGGNDFMESFADFSHSTTRAGMFNSLSQTLLKLTCPGVPDIYQGNELWDLSLVDPDNRRAVDYSTRLKILQEMQKWPQSAERLKPHVRELINHMSDGRIKMYLTWKALCLRKQYPELFLRGNYRSLNVQGPKAKHLLAFTRWDEKRELIVAVPRLCSKLFNGNGESSAIQDWWKETRLELPPSAERRTYRNVFTGEQINLEPSGQASHLPANALFTEFPLALLYSTSRT
jgi:(1->4)-alpha-D-glucan 1-alpha-D-glucosylmutase